MKLGHTKVEVRRVPEGVLIQVEDRWHLVLTPDAALELSVLLTVTAAEALG